LASRPTHGRCLYGAPQLALWIVLSLGVLLNASRSFSDDAVIGGNTTVSKIIPIAVEQSFLDGIGLVTNAPSEREDNIEVQDGEHIENSSHIFHTGKIMVAVYQAGPGKVHIDNAAYDEFVHILEGRLILTPDDGGTFEFKKGDSLVVPKGYTGYWHMPEKYRELIVIDTDELQSE
jgi:uncharacterized cupin superfamily protein